MFKNFIAAITLLCSVMGFSQISYEKGYYIDNEGNRKDCLIRNADWKDNPSGFDFKTDESEASKNAKIADYAEFGVCNFIFRRFTVNIDRSTADTSFMSIKKEPEFNQETLYLREIVSGDATLYKYENRNLLRFFSAQGNEVPQQLIYKPYKESNDQVAYNQSYKGQLYQALGGEIKDYSRFKKAGYNESDLSKLYADYNGVPVAKESNSNNENSASKSQLHLKITPGVDFVTSDNVNIDSETSMKLDAKACFRIGLEAEWVLPFNKNKWSLILEPSYRAYEQTGYQSFKSGADREDNGWKIKYSHIDIALGIRHYMFVNQNLKFFVNAGMVYSFVAGSSSAEFYYESSFSDYTRSAEPGNGTNFLGGLGIAYKSFSLEARYNSNRQIFANYSFWNSKVSSIGIVAGYKFL